MKTRDNLQRLASLHAEYPELHRFIQTNKDASWLKWEEFVSEGDESDFKNLEQVILKESANNELEILQISLNEWNYIYKHNKHAVDLLISGPEDHNESIQLLLTLSREINLFNEPLANFRLDDKANLIIHLWQDIQFMQAFMILCKNPSHQQLLFANNMSALIQMSELKDNDPQFFAAIMHAVSNQTTLVLTEFNHRHKNYFALQDELKEVMTQIIKVDNSPIQMTSKEILTSILGEFNAHLISASLQRNRAMRDFLKNGSNYTDENRISVLIGYLYSLAEVFPNQSEIEKILNENYCEKELACKQYQKYLVDYRDSLIPNPESDPTHYLVLKKLLATRPENCTDDISLLYDAVRIVAGIDVNSELGRMGHDMQRAINDAYCDILINPLDTTNRQRLLDLAHDFEHCKVGALAIASLLLVASIVLIAAIVVMAIFVPPIAILGPMITNMLLAWAGIVLGATATPSMIGGIFYFCEASRYHQKARNVSAIIPLQESLITKVITGEDTQEKSSNANKSKPKT